MTDQPNHPEQEPRRSASAKFEVKSSADSSLDLREAMDTAHRSLAASLQLSFRALQGVMLVLVLLYLVSGFRTVEDSQTGVGTFFGAIVSDEGLMPGLQTNWPPPIGGFAIYDAQGRKTNVGYVFKPRIDARLTQEQRITKARASDALRPGRDGYLLTRDGDLAHIEVAVEWEVVDPIQYAHTIPDADANVFVKTAIERATVYIVAQLTIEELLDKPLEELRALIQLEAQHTLNELKCGIRLSDVFLPSEPEPPLFIQKSYATFDSASINAETTIEQALASAHEILIEAAGVNHETLLAYISTYEDASEINDTVTMETSLEKINAFLQSDEISGKVANMLSTAEGYRSQIETTLGQDYRRFKSLLPAYHEHPDLVIRNMWLDMYSNVLSNDDVETIFVPEYISAMRLGITGSDVIAQLRHKNRLIRKEREALLNDKNLLNPWSLRASEIRGYDEKSRELFIKDGVVQGRK